MKFTILALLATVGATTVCRDDVTCSHNNFVKKKCCSDFECNAYCNTKRCRVDSCGRTHCAIRAADFTSHVHAASDPKPGVPGVPEVPAVAPVPAVPARVDLDGNEVAGTSRPAIAGREARPARAEVAPTPGNP